MRVVASTSVSAARPNELRFGRRPREWGVADVGAAMRPGTASCRLGRGMKAARRRFYLGQRQSETPEWAAVRAQAKGTKLFTSMPISSV